MEFISNNPGNETDPGALSSMGRVRIGHAAEQSPWERCACKVPLQKDVPIS